VVSQIPFTDGLASAARVPPLTALKVTARAVRDDLSALRGRPPVPIPLVGPPGSTALMSAPDAKPGVDRLTEGLDVPEHVAARVATRVTFYRPGLALARLRCPVLLCVCDEDSVAPAKAALRH